LVEIIGVKLSKKGKKKKESKITLLSFLSFALMRKKEGGQGSKPLKMNMLTEDRLGEQQKRKRWKAEKNPKTIGDDHFFSDDCREKRFVMQVIISRGRPWERRLVRDRRNV
jgi:hypothetical protein